MPIAYRVMCSVAGPKKMSKPVTGAKAARGPRKENADIRAGLDSLKMKPGNAADTPPQGKRERRMSKMAVESAALKEMQVTQCAQSTSVVPIYSAGVHSVSP